MVTLPAGQLRMGSPADEEHRNSDEGPEKDVTIPRAFAIGRYPVTHRQYADFVAATGHAGDPDCNVIDKTGNWQNDGDASWRDPGFAQTDNDPVVCVSQRDALAYAAWLSGKTGRPYRLLTEAEFEYAARAGTSTSYWWQQSADQGCRFANLPDRSTRALYPSWSKTADCDDHFPFTSPVGRFAPNRFGLYDMAGNAWSWTSDCVSPDYATPAPPPRDGVCEHPLRRGGSWVKSTADLRSAARGRNHAGNYASDGFRIARDMP